MNYILIVDDDQNSRKILSGYIVIAGGSTLEAQNADEAQALIGTPNLKGAIVDLRIPKRDGWAILHDIQRLQPRLPVIAISGYAEPELFPVARAEGFIALYPKPLSEKLADDLISQLSELLNH